MSEHRSINNPANLEGLCGNCNGACCRKGTILELSDNERKFFEKGGANIVNAGCKTRSEVEAYLRDQLGDIIFNGLVRVHTDAPEYPSYLLLEDCPYLVVEKTTGKSICSAYNDPSKPAICSSFEPGSSACTQMRDVRFVNPVA
ncbi:MAG: hypothetical protein AAB914_04665 [Patescibacteria group bacterium]